GFRSKMGKPFAGLIRLNPDLKPEFDFGQGQANGNGATVVDFSGQEPLGQCPKCGARVFVNGTSYVCEKAVRTDRTCDFRVGRIILQQPIELAQLQKLLTARKTDLLPKFISKKGRAFAAYLLVDKDGKVGFEFQKREPKAKGGAAKKSKEPQPKIDFTGQEALGSCPKCRPRLCEADTEYLCEKAGAATQPFNFRAGMVVLQQPIARAQIGKLLAEGKTDLLDKFVSRHGKPFSAWLTVSEDGKVSFEFPPR